MECTKTTFGKGLKVRKHGGKSVHNLLISVRTFWYINRIPAINFKLLLAVHHKRKDVDS
jgi:hypothetical protein